MNWMGFRWVWRLEAPLFVGMPPAGSLNRCRLYLPGRTVHGAFTAELARRNGNKKEAFPDYKKFYKNLEEHCRFTYLFPAQKQGDKFLTWLPTWLPELRGIKGFQWYCHERKECISDREFRGRLLATRPGVAIAPESDSASEGSLRETECINPWWNDGNNKKKTNSVLLLGYVFLKNGSFWQQLESINTIFVGGDIRYGLGKICRIELHELKDSSLVFGKKVYLDGKHPEIESNTLFGHGIDDGLPENNGMKGAKELLGGWNQGKQWRGELGWVPGSGSCSDKSKRWSITTFGYWKHENQ